MTEQPKWKLLRVKFLPLTISGLGKCVGAHFTAQNPLHAGQLRLFECLQVPGTTQDTASSPKGYSEPWAEVRRQVWVCSLGRSGKLTREPEFWMFPSIALFISAHGGPSQVLVSWGAGGWLRLLTQDTWKSLMEEASLASNRTWEIGITTI